MSGQRAYEGADLAARSSRSNSLIAASRMNCPRLFSPATASILSFMSAGNRTRTATVSTFLFSGGRPMRGLIAGSAESVNSFPESDIAYLTVNDIGFNVKT